MRRLRGDNVMVLRTDRRALYIYTESQWINVLVTMAATVLYNGTLQDRSYSTLTITEKHLALRV